MPQDSEDEGGEDADQRGCYGQEEGDCCYGKGRGYRRAAEDAHNVPEVREQRGLLVDAADAGGRRASDSFLQVREVQLQLEKLRLVINFICLNCM